MTLDVIKELMQILNPKGFKSKGRTRELFDYLEKKPNTTNSELLLHFYPGDPHGQVYLSNLKKKLLNDLQNQVLYQLPEEYSKDVQKAYFYCHKMNAVGHILLGQNKRKAAVKVMDEVFNKALKHGFTQIIVSSSTLLRRHYGVIIGNEKKMIYFHNIIEEYSQIQDLEQKVEYYYIDIRSNFPKSKKTARHLIQRAEGYITNIRIHLNKVNSYRFHLLSYDIILALEQIKGKPMRIIEACDEAVSYFAKSNSVPINILFSFNFHKIPPLIQLGDKAKLNTVVSDCLRYCSKGTYNWIILHQYQVISHLYSLEFESAYELTLEAKPQARKHESLYEMWVILEAYTHFLTGRKYRLQKFLNEVPTYEKDKRGMNINVLIIQILYQLQRKKYEQIVERVEAIKAYSYKYLREDDTYRSNCFIRMLLTLKPCGFKRGMVEKRAAELLGKMKGSPIRDIDMEPVRYEVLWEKVLELLK